MGKLFRPKSEIKRSFLVFVVRFKNPSKLWGHARGSYTPEV